MDIKAIALLTDFGLQDPYVGVMKGVILGIAPGATLVDLTHGVAQGDVRAASFNLLTSFRYFPSGTVFCCVVDPGVGCGRHALAVQLEFSEDMVYTFVAPDNGLLSAVLDAATSVRAVVLSDARYTLPEISRTFHGRDVFAPVAAHLANGESLHNMGPGISAADLQRINWPRPVQDERGWQAEIVHVDRFGNLVTNLTTAELESGRAWTVSLGDTVIGPIHTTFSDVKPGRPLAYLGSSGFLEIAVRDAKASDLLEVGEGRVSLTPRVEAANR